MNSGSSGLRATASIGADAETRQPLAIEQSIEVGASHGIAAPTQTQTPSKRTTHGSQWLYNARLKQSTIPQPRKNEDADTAGLSATTRLQPLNRSSTEIYDATHSFLLDVAFSARGFGFPFTPAQS
jgi:hypothetical protein